MFQNWKEVEKEHVLYLLEQLKELFTNKNNWIDWPEAVDTHGNTIDPLDPNAKKWNLLGASMKIASEKYKYPLAHFIDCAARDFLYELSDDNVIGKLLSYDDEFALICLGLEYLKIK